MQFLTDAEASAWCERAAIAPLQKTETWPRVRCAVPAASARLAWFADWLVRQVPGIHERLLWIRETGIWPSSENLALVDGLRRGFGERRPVGQAPATSASAEQAAELAALVVVTLLCGWDAELYGSQDMLRVIISHDE